MTISRKQPKKEQGKYGCPPNIPGALKLIEHWLETDESNSDTSDWENLKEILDRDRMSDRKFFSNE